MNRQSSVSIDLMDRIERLFAERHLFQHSAVIGSDNMCLLNAMRRVQATIYHLDKYFEKNWVLNGSTLTEMWCAISGAVNAIIGSSVLTNRLLSDVRRYQALEESFRTLGPINYELSHYYYFKTCDVRLSRRLLFGKRTRQISKYYNRCWALYDLIAEICDDLSDLIEDVDTFNGNRFLLGMVSDGPTIVQHQYHKMIDNIEDSIRVISQRVSKFDESKFQIEAALIKIREARDWLERYDNQSQLENSLVKKSALGDAISGSWQMISKSGRSFRSMTPMALQCKQIRHRRIAGPVLLP